MSNNECLRNRQTWQGIQRVPTLISLYLSRLLVSSFVRFSVVWDIVLWDSITRKFLWFPVFQYCCALSLCKYTASIILYRQYMLRQYPHSHTSIYCCASAPNAQPYFLWYIHLGPKMLYSYIDIYSCDAGICRHRQWHIWYTSSGWRREEVWLLLKSVNFFNRVLGSGIYRVLYGYTRCCIHNIHSWLVFLHWCSGTNV